MLHPTLNQTIQTFHLRFPFVIPLLMGQGLIVALIGGAINGALGCLFFWLLKKTEQSSLWWLVEIGGVLVALFV